VSKATFPLSWCLIQPLTCSPEVCTFSCHCHSNPFSALYPGTFPKCKPSHASIPPLLPCSLGLTPNIIFFNQVGPFCYLLSKHHVLFLPSNYYGFNCTFLHVTNRSISFSSLYSNFHKEKGSAYILPFHGCFPSN
jgi:hypothetical protein